MRLYVRFIECGGLNLVSNVAEDTDRDFNSLVRANSQRLFSY